MRGKERGTTQNVSLQNHIKNEENDTYVLTSL